MFVFSFFFFYLFLIDAKHCFYITNVFVIQCRLDLLLYFIIEIKVHYTVEELLWNHLEGQKKK